MAVIHHWVYDGVHDPVLVGQLLALIQGEAEPQAQSITGTPDPTVTTGPPATDRPLTASGAATVASTGEGTEVQIPAGPAGSMVVRINRVLVPGDGPGTGAGVSATWQQPDGLQARGSAESAGHAVNVLVPARWDDCVLEGVSQDPPA